MSSFWKKKRNLLLKLICYKNTLITGAVPANLTEFDVPHLLVQRRKEILNKPAIVFGKVIEVFNIDTNESKT